LGDSFATFRECLEREGHADADLQKAVTDFESMGPEVRDALARCNNESGIVQTMQDLQKESENLEPNEIEARNRGLKAFAKCSKKHGYDMGELKPNSDGLLSPSGALGDGLKDLDKIMDICGPDAAEAAGEDANY